MNDRIRTVPVQNSDSVLRNLHILFRAAQYFKDSAGTISLIGVTSFAQVYHCIAR